MNLTVMKLMAPLVALTTMGIVACSEDATRMAGDDPLRDAEEARGVETPAPLDPALTPTPPDPLPDAPPEIVAPGAPVAIPTEPQTPLDDPNAPPGPPPVLPETPPG